MKRKLKFENHGTLMRVLERFFRILEPVMLYIAFILFWCGIKESVLAYLGDIPTGIIGMFLSFEDAAFMAIPFIVSLSAAKEFDCDPFSSLLLIACLSAESAEEGIKNEVYFADFFGIKIKSVAISGSILQPIIYVLIFFAVCRLLKSDRPIARLLALLISLTVCTILLNPLLIFIEKGFSLVFMLIFTYLKFIAGAVIGFIYPLVCIFSPMPPASATDAIIATNRGDILLPAICAANAAIAGAAFSTFIASKTKYMKLLSFFSAAASLLGFNEAALFGIDIYSAKRLSSAVLGGGLGGALMAFSEIKLTGTKTAGISAFFYIPDRSRWIFISALAVSFLASFFIASARTRCNREA